MSQEKELPTATLVDSPVPADQGLSALGLLMQLAGSVFAAMVTLFAFTMIAAPDFRGQKGALFLLLAACVGRSLTHRWAGGELLYGKRTADELGGPLSALKKYIAVGLAHSVLVTALVSVSFEMPAKFAVTLGVALALWPAALAILLKLPRFQRFQAELPVPEDKGFEGAAILMVVLGTIGVLCSGVVLIVLLKGGDMLMRQGFGVLLLGAAAMLVIRSALHVQAGISGLRETSLERAVEHANRYANFGVISSFCVGAAFLMIMFRVAFHPITFAVVAGMCWMLLAWPLILRRFFSDRQFTDLLAGEEASVHRRAPDAGLTGLGWLLFGHAIYSATMTLPELVLGGDGGMMSALWGMSELDTTRSVWWGAGVIVLQGWAGFELIRMSPSSKVFATVYAIVAAAVAIYTTLPVLDALDELNALAGGPMGFMQFAPLAIALVIPVATLVLVNRKITPTATARFRPKAPATTGEPAEKPPEA